MNVMSPFTTNITIGKAILLENLDLNIEEFKHLLMDNIGKLESQQQSSLTQNPFNNPKALEISRLSMKIEGSKPRLENESSIKSSQTSEGHQFNGTWSATPDSKMYSSNILQVMNTGYSSNHYFITDGTIKEENQSEESTTRDNKKLQQKISNSTQFVSGRDQLFNIFEEEYEIFFESLRRLLPNPQISSHVMRCMKKYDRLSGEFLYSIMMDLKEIEKNLVLLHHETKNKEKLFHEKKNKLLKHQDYDQRNTVFCDERDKIKDNGEFNSGLTTTFLKNHYQALIRRLNQFHGEKIELLKQSLSNERTYNDTKVSIGELYVDLVEGLEYEDLGDQFQKNMDKLKNLHKLIGEIWNNKQSDQEIEKQTKTERLRESYREFNSPAELTILEKDDSEFKTKKNTIRHAKDIDETQSNISSSEGKRHRETELSVSESSRFSELLKQKDNEISVIRKKEKVYQKLRKQKE